MNCLIALALAVAADPQVPSRPPPPPEPVTPAQAPAAPLAAPPAPTAAVSTVDGNWTVVYAENTGRPIQMGPNLAIQNGTVTINLGQPTTYRLVVGPGHSIEAKPAIASVPGANPVISPPTADTGPSASPVVPGPRTVRGAPEPGTLQGVFILSQEYLCLSLSPVAAEALGASPGTVTGTPNGPTAAPGGGPPPVAQPVTQAAPAAAGGGVRQDAFVLILRRAR